MIQMNSLALSAVSLLLAACAAKPIISGDSTVQQKSISFPKQGQQVHVVIGGIVHLKAGYQNSYSYHLTKPLALGFMLGRLYVSNQVQINQASLDGQKVFCTDSNVYSDSLAGPLKVACFESKETGKFHNVKVAPGEMWFNKEIFPPVDYVSSEHITTLSGGQALKRELIYEGGQNDTLLFTEKIYENSIDVATRTKPILAKVETVPSKVTLNGAEIYVTKFSGNSLTFVLEKPWD